MTGVPSENRGRARERQDNRDQGWPIISVSGQIGSGKSSVAGLLGQLLSRKVVSTGSIQRRLAQERGMTTLEFNLHSESNLDLDDLIDKNLIALRLAGEEVIVDSRMAWFFIPESLKVFLIVDPIVGARRVLLDNDRAATEIYSDQEVAHGEIRRRQESERKRFSLKYGIDYTNFSNYDLVIDTTHATPEEVASQIIDQLSRPMATPGLWLCPRRLYPTQNIRALRNENVHPLLAIIQAEGFNVLPPIEVIRIDERFFIYDGHKRVSAALQGNHRFVPAWILFNKGDEVFPGMYVEDYVRNECTLSSLYDWEDCHEFHYLEYPPECFRKRDKAIPRN